MVGANLGSRGKLGLSFLGRITSSQRILGSVHLKKKIMPVSYLVPPETRSCFAFDNFHENLPWVGAVPQKTFYQQVFVDGPVKGLSTLGFKD